MKSFQAVIIAAIVASSAAINEPVASPILTIEHELAEYERQLQGQTSPPVVAPTTLEPTAMVSLYSMKYRCLSVSLLRMIGAHQQ